MKALTLIRRHAYDTGGLCNRTSHSVRGHMVNEMIIQPRPIVRVLSRIAVALALFPLLVMPCTAAERVVRVGVYQNKPTIFVDESGHPAGLFIDLLKAVAANAQWTLLLRSDERDERNETPKGEKGGRMKGSETILLVEDEKAVREITSMFLSSLGYKVIAMESPEDALAAVERGGGHPIDLMITDVIMPGMSGRDLSLRMAHKIPGLRCIFMSGYTADIITDQGVLAANVVFLEKPFSRDQIARKVRAVLDA